MNKLDKEQQLDLFWKKFNVFYSFFKEENPNSVGLEAFKSIAFNAFNKKRLGELKKSLLNFTVSVGNFLKKIKLF